MTDVRITQNPIYFNADDRIQYAIDVVNSGNVTIAGPLGVNGGLINPSCPLINGEVTVGELVTCTGEHEVLQADLDAGEVAKSLSVESVAGVLSNTVDATATAAITISKALTANDDADESGSVSVGDTLTYRIEVTNRSGGDLNSVQVTDSLITPESENCSILGSGSSCILQGSYTVQANDAGGTLVNTATGTSIETGTVSASVETEVDPGQ